VILSAVYALTLYRRVVYGTLQNPQLSTITDMDRREWITFLPLIIGALLLGVAPSLVTDVTAASVEALIVDFGSNFPNGYNDPRV
jgi:NADH-quinone oxidoreductase subunit M